MLLNFVTRFIEYIAYVHRIAVAHAARQKVSWHSIYFFILGINVKLIVHGYIAQITYYFLVLLCPTYRKIPYNFQSHRQDVNDNKE